MRLHPEDSTFARLVLVAGFVTGIAVAALLIHDRAADEGIENEPAGSLPAAGDPELIRCRDLGMAAAEDESCLAAWSEEQRRFFGTSQTSPSVPSALPPAGGIEEGAVDEQAGEMEVQSE
jgi:conjugative transfer region protein TrbK